MKRIFDNQLKTMLCKLVNGYESLTRAEVQKTANILQVPPNQLWRALFAEQIQREREDIKSTWPRSDGWLKFEAHKTAIFRREVFQPTSTPSPFGKGYTFRPASLTYDHLYWKIYHELGGDDIYETDEELCQRFRQCVQGHRLLEIGCCPGFALKVLKSHGAHCRGIDICDLRIPGIFNVDIGNARELASRYGNGKFDLIISRDFFCEPTVITQEDSGKVLNDAYQLLKPGGVMISEISFIRTNTPMGLIATYFMMKEDGYEGNIEEFIDFSFASEKAINLSEWTNRLSIRIDNCVAAGFTGFAVKPEAEYLTVVLRK